MVLVGHAALIVALLPSTPCPTHIREIIIVFTQPGLVSNMNSYEGTYTDLLHTLSTVPCRLDRALVAPPD